MRGWALVVWMLGAVACGARPDPAVEAVGVWYEGLENLSVLEFWWEGTAISVVPFPGRKLVVVTRLPHNPIVLRWRDAAGRPYCREVVVSLPLPEVPASSTSTLVLEVGTLGEVRARLWIGTSYGPETASRLSRDVTQSSRAVACPEEWEV
jgi:hypothetical protein